MVDFTRGVMTLVGAGVAGFLIWLAAQIGTGSSSEYWATYGLVAAGGLTMALSQLLGGWTKWGWPRISSGVFLLGFLPVLVAGGWILLSRQPADFFNTSNWSRDLGIDGAVGDLGEFLAVVAFGIGLTFGFVFDTAGPRRHVEPDLDVQTVDERQRAAAGTTLVAEPVAAPTERAADEALTAERSAGATSDEPVQRRYGLRRVGARSDRDDS